jgi:hypothetical protein
MFVTKGFAATLTKARSTSLIQQGYGKPVDAGSRRVSDLSLKLSRAVSRGRATKGVPRNRAEILHTLLRKRAEAHRRGQADHEQKLRDQITWSLPIEDGEAE